VARYAKIESAPDLAASYRQSGLFFFSYFPRVYVQPSWVTVRLAISRFRPAGALCRQPDIKHLENHNDYAEMTASIEYATDLHTQNKRAEFEAIERYPIIRLPHEFKSLAGRTAHVCQTQNNGKLAFLITLDEEVGNVVATNEVDKRLSALENKTDTFLQFISVIKGYTSDNIKKEPPESGFEPESEPR
jgi:hypothetical protein